MAGEGVVNERLGAHSLRFFHDGCSAGGLVDFEEDVGFAGHHVRLFVDGADEEKNVVTDFLDLVDGRRRSGDALAMTVAFTSGSGPCHDLGVGSPVRHELSDR